MYDERFDEVILACKKQTKKFIYDKIGHGSDHLDACICGVEISSAGNIHLENGQRAISKDFEIIALGKYLKNTRCGCYSGIRLQRNIGVSETFLRIARISFFYRKPFEFKKFLSTTYTRN